MGGKHLQMRSRGIDLKGEKTGNFVIFAKD